MPRSFDWSRITSSDLIQRGPGSASARSPRKNLARCPQRAETSGQLLVDLAQASRYTPARAPSLVERAAHEARARCSPASRGLRAAPSGVSSAAGERGGRGPLDQQEPQGVHRFLAAVVAVGAGAQVVVAQEALDVHQRRHRAELETLARLEPAEHQRPGVALAGAHELVGRDHLAAADERQVDRRGAVVGLVAVVARLFVEEDDVAVGGRADAVRQHDLGAIERGAQAAGDAHADERHAREPLLVAQVLRHAVQLARREHLVLLEERVLRGDVVEVADGVGHDGVPFRLPRALCPRRNFSGASQVASVRSG